MKTTKAHYELFKEECEYWIDKFNLREWRVSYRWELTSNDNEAMAEYNAHYQAKKVLITFSKKIIQTHDKTNDLIREIAFHEICELLLVPLRAQAAWRGYDEDERESATHSIIHRLFRLLGVN